MRLLVIQGPGLNLLGQRDPALYGTASLDTIHARIQEHANELGVDVAFFQSNNEGSLIDYLQQEYKAASGIIINPGALTHYGLSLRETLQDTGLPIVEVHLSNIHAREEWRRKSVVASIAVAQISGLGWRGYLSAFQFLIDHIKEPTS